jgi:ABC-type transport system involved in multi-copper enzyme maturation permease subunit
MWLLIRKETLENILTMRFLIGFVACNLVFGVISFILVQDFNLDLQRVEAARYDIEQDIENWEVYSYVRPTVIKEPSPLSVFGTKESKGYGSRVWISHTRIPVFTSDETTGGDSTDYLGFFYSFDFVSVVQIFVSLLAFLFSFDLICGEKERATLRLVLSNSVKRTKLFAGKFLGSTLALTIVILSSFITALLIFLFNTALIPQTGHWVNIVLLVLSTVLYGAVFIAIGMLVSVLTHKTSTSLIVCMIIWVFVILIVPSTIGFFSSEFGMSSASRDFERELNALYSEHGPAMQSLNRLELTDGIAMNNGGSSEGRRINRIMGSKAERTILNRMPAAIKAQYEFATRRYDLEKKYLDSRNEKTTLTQNLLRISPASLFGNIANSIAMTGRNSHDFFMEQTRRYREQVIAYLEGKGAYSSRRWFTNDQPDAPYRQLVEDFEKLTPQEMGELIANRPDLIKKFMGWIREFPNDPKRKLKLSDMPRFKQENQSFGKSFETAYLDFLLLAIIMSICLVVSFAKFITYDPR